MHVWIQIEVNGTLQNHFQKLQYVGVISHLHTFYEMRSVRCAISLCAMISSYFILMQDLLNTGHLCGNPNFSRIYTQVIRIESFLDPIPAQNP